MEDRDLMVGQRLCVGSLKPRHFSKHVVTQDCPVEPLLRHVPTEHRGVVEILCKMGAVDEQLLGYAATDDASATNLILLGNGHSGAISRRDTGRADAA
jgi:hypothetical protein